MAGRGAVVVPADREREGFGDPARGDASWFTLISGDRTPSSRLSAGLMELPPGGVGLPPHRHAEPEVYHVVAGDGVVTIDGVPSPVGPGATVFIPGDAEHALVNAGAATLRVFYAFAVDRFSDVVYRFS